jgi:endonuclease/exonuclease/phosphatase family metal-dependent hydrolase
LINLVASYDDATTLLIGDFNINETNAVWTRLYSFGYKPVLSNVATTLKRKCTIGGAYRNHAIDNIFYPASDAYATSFGYVDFVLDCKRLDNARFISDHLPVFVSLHILD